MKELTIERINKQQALNIINSVSHYRRESTYWHDYLGVDFEKPFYAGILSGSFTVNQLVKALPQLKESYAIIGLVRKNRAYETVSFIGLDHAKPELLPCQVENIYRKSLFEEIRKSSDCEAVVIIPDKVEWRMPKWRNTNYDKGIRYENKKSSVYQFDKSGYCVTIYRGSLRERYRAFHTQNQIKAFQALNKEADRLAAVALKTSLINDVKNLSSTICTLSDIEHVRDRLSQLRWVISAIDYFMKDSESNDTPLNMYNHKKNMIDHEFLRYIERYS